VKALTRCRPTTAPRSATRSRARRPRADSLNTKV
jgi:hypothetical protein